MALSKIAVQRKALDISSTLISLYNAAYALRFGGTDLEKERVKSTLTYLEEKIKDMEKDDDLNAFFYKYNLKINLDTFRYYLCAIKQRAYSHKLLDEIIKRHDQLKLEIFATK